MLTTTPSATRVREVASRVGIDSMRVTSVRSASHGLVGVRRQKRFPLARRFLFMVGAVMGILLLMNVAYLTSLSPGSDLDDLDENELLSWRKKRKSPPSPPPTPAENIIRGLQRLLDAKIITKEQFEKKKAKALTPPPPPRGPPPPPPSYASRRRARRNGASRTIQFLTRARSSRLATRCASPY